MAGVSHDVLLLALKENPELLGELLRRAAGVSLPCPMTVGDSAVKFAVSLEKYPDLLFHGPPAPAAPDSAHGEEGLGEQRASDQPNQGERVPWAIVELQNKRDETKSRSWHLAMSVLLQANGMGDLIVITASRAVARWATRIGRLRGALGTKKTLEPVVLHLSKKEVEQLLDPSVPQLALFAVWARARGDGPIAKEIVSRALGVTEVLPPPLREAQTRAIMAMLSERLLRFLKEKSMDVNQIPEPKLARQIRLYFEDRGRQEGERQGRQEGERHGRQEGEREGKRESLLSVLAARGFSLDDAASARVASLEDPEVLDEHIRRAVTAATLAEVFEAPANTTGTPKTRKRPGSSVASERPKKRNGHPR